MLTIKRSVAIIAILFSPLSTASNLTSQLHNFFSAQLAGVSDEVRVSIRTAPAQSTTAVRAAIAFDEQ